MSVSINIHIRTETERGYTPASAHVHSKGHVWLRIEDGTGQSVAIFLPDGEGAQKCADDIARAFNALVERVRNKEQSVAALKAEAA